MQYKDALVGELPLWINTLGLVSTLKRSGFGTEANEQSSKEIFMPFCDGCLFSYTQSLGN